MTSNLGSEYVLDGKIDMVMDEVRRYFRPEFVNRVDEIIVFNALDKVAIRGILDKIISEIEERLNDIKINIVLTEKAKDQFIEEGYDINYGARPLKRLVSRTLETDLAKMIIEDESPETPIQKKLGQVGKTLGIGCLIICVIIFILGI